MSAQPFVPEGANLEQLREAAKGCEGCALHGPASQTVFSRGPAAAKVVFVGEQPGDQEDRRGQPFVGPAGQLLDRAVDAAGLDPASIYTTNAVKHFKFTPSATGNRRIHATPDLTEVAACRPWLVAEFRVLDPKVVVALGATAAKSLFGPRFRVTQSRGILLPWPNASATPEAFAHDDDGSTVASYCLATLHPSAVLRADNQEAAFDGLVADLRIVADVVNGG